MFGEVTPRTLMACVLLFTSVSLSSVAQAQVAAEIAVAERETLDENGVNVATGGFRMPRTDLIIGSGPGAVTLDTAYDATIYRDARIWRPGSIGIGSTINVNIGIGRKAFQRTSSGYVQVNGNDGSQLISIGYGKFMLRMRDGTRYLFEHIEYIKKYTYVGTEQTPEYVYLSAIISPDGNRLTLNWLSQEYCTTGRNFGTGDDGVECNTTQGGNTPGFPHPLHRLTRLKSLESSAGYSITPSYAFDLHEMYPVPSQAQIDSSLRMTGAQGGNVHGGPGSLPSVDYAITRNAISGGYVQTDDVTDATGRTWRYTTQFGSAGNYRSIRRPGSSVDDIRVNLNASYRVTSVVKNGATWSYSYSAPTSTTSAMVVTGPTGRIRKYESNTAIGMPTRVEDEYGRATLYVYDANGRLTSTTSPGGQVTSHVYDAKGNVTTTTVTAAGGGATLVSSAVYTDLSCSSASICNRMTSTTDARGGVTTYGYDPTHGGTTSVVMQNPSGVSPSLQTRYAQVSGVWLPVRSWTCRTTAACDGTGDAVQAVTAYNANLLPVSVTRGAGDGSLTATSTLTYTAAGDVSTVDGPLAGADVVRTYYDAARRPSGSIGPDPDAAGALSHRAVRLGYDAAGRPTTAERGIAPDQSDGGLASLSVLQTQTATLDAAGRAVSLALSAGGTTFSRVDYKYDAAGHQMCAAQRMNPAALGSPQDACVVGGDAGFGSDRVTFMQYSPFGAGQPAQVSVTSGYGTAAASTETIVQTVTGQASSVTDGNGNVTTYAYDGFDRRSKTTFPGGSYEQTLYAANGDVSAIRLRDAKQITFGYDGLGRPTSTVFQNPVDLTDANLTYGYDLLGRMTLLADVNGHDVSYQYDALGRVTSEAGIYGTMSSQYDAADRRTRLTWGDGFHVGYEYNLAGEMTAIRENGAMVLASYGYDNLGRRVSRLLGNGTSTTYGYDAGSRLTALSLNGGNQPLSVTLSYNPSGQIASRTGTNDAYAWTGATNIDRDYAVNGLNQYTASGSVVPTYDGRGNLTSAGDATYLYNSKNQLSGANGTYLYYDAAGRLDQVTQSGPGWQWDGSRLVTERQGGTIARRYVHGAGVDEPVVWYDGAGTGARHWLDADERGSIVRVTNDAGTATAINAYDEYGIPGGGNVGRFQYTGQMWLSELGFYHYKARMYSPTLGRFLQTDPIGYADGLNRYDYVGGDPVNRVDPTGTDALCGFGRRAVYNRDNFTGQAQTSSTEIVVLAGYRCEADDDEIFFMASRQQGGAVFGPGQPLVPGSRQTPRWPRKLDDYERRILKCNGADDETLNEVTVAGFLPPHAYLSPETDGQTLPDGGGTTIFLRNGNASGSTSLDHMWLIAHEFSHAMGYNRGVSVADILLQYAQHGYYNSPAEVAARAYGDRVKNSIKSGQCR